MRYKVRPADFRVEEQVRLPPDDRGPFAVYRVRKWGVTTPTVRARLAARLGVPQRAVAFPALKDKVAVAVQHATVRGGGPRRVTGPGFAAERVAWLSRPLTPGDIVANRFALTLRDMTAAEAAAVSRRMEHLGADGLPNYFDRQRFGSFALDEPDAPPIGKLILRRDAENALRAYLTRPAVGDPPEVVRFKRFAADHWPDWEALFAAAPRPSNYRSVLTYLRDHPHPSETTYRRALDLITRRLLSLHLAAYQSLLWNRIAGRYLTAVLGEPPSEIEIAGERLPLHRAASGLADDLPLPGHRAVYRPEVAQIVARVLAEEGFELRDLKARILKNAYLPRGSRAVWLRPLGMSVSAPSPDELFIGRWRLDVAFTLPRGSYGTLVLRAAGGGD